MAEEEPEALPPCLWETKNEEGEWGEGTTDEGYPVGEVRDVPLLGSISRVPFQKRASSPSLRVREC